MSIESKEIELHKIKEDVSSIDTDIKKIYEKDMINYEINDVIPKDWGRSKLKLNIPLDMLDVRYLDDTFNKLKVMIVRRSELRRREANLMLAIGEIKIQETVPD